MLFLSNKLTKLLKREIPDATLATEGKTLCLYLGQVSSILRDDGFLNIALWDGEKACGISLSDFDSFHGKVKFQENLHKLNSSEVVGLSKENWKIYLQHWDGYRTELDAVSLKILGQKFTK